VIRVFIGDPNFHQAYWRAQRALPVIELERPAQYFQRWREEYNCRVIGDQVEFYNDQDYTAFMLRWA
jgi:hypothetical protein